MTPHINPHRLSPAPPVVQKQSSSQIPPGFRWLLVPIPGDLHSHIHHQARLSNMSLKAYLGWFLRSAVPFRGQDSAASPPGHSQEGGTSQK